MVYDLRKILTLDIIRVNVFYCSTETRCCIESRHVRSSTLKQDPLFCFRRNVSTRTDTNKCPATITNRRNQWRGNFCDEQIAIFIFKSFYRHNRQWQYVAVRTYCGNLLQQSVGNFQSWQGTIVVCTKNQISFLSGIRQIIGKCTNRFLELVHISSRSCSLYSICFCALQQGSHFFFCYHITLTVY